LRRARWSHGCELATESRRDFDTITTLIRNLYPDAEPLTVLDAPSL
jgi:hypothetical protein